MGQRRGDTDKAHHASRAHLLQSLHEPARLALLHRGIMELHHVDTIPAETLQAHLDAANQVVPCPFVLRIVLNAVRLGAPALRGQVELRIPMRRQPTDHLFAIDIIMSRVNKIDPRIEHTIVKSLNLIQGHSGPTRPMQCRTKPETCDLKPCSAKNHAGKFFKHSNTLQFKGI